MDRAIASEIAPRKPATVETAAEIGAAQALLGAAVEGADGEDDEVLACEPARHHGDVDDVRHAQLRADDDDGDEQHER